MENGKNQELTQAAREEIKTKPRNSRFIQVWKRNEEQKKTNVVGNQNNRNLWKPLVDKFSRERQLKTKSNRTKKRKNSTRG